MVNVYEFVLPDGTCIGCGTKAEFDHWSSEGVFDADARLGAIIGQEPDVAR